MTLSTFLFTYLVDSLIIHSYSKSIFKQKFSNKVSFAIILVSYYLCMVIFRYVITSYEILNIVSIFVVNILLFKFMNYNSIKSALFHGFVIGTTQLMSEFVTVYIFAMVLKESVQESMAVHFQIEAMTALIVYFLMSRLLILFSKKGNTTYSYGKWFSLLILPLSSMILLITLRVITNHIALDTTESVLLITSCGLLLLTNILIFVIYEYSEANTQKLMELEMTSQKNEIDLTYLSLLEKKNEQLQILSHDYKNNLLTLGSMSDSSEIKEYINNMIGDISAHTRVCKTSNKILDLILSKYTDICDDKGITFDIDIITDNLAFLSGNDISSLFNNLLDNAVESAEKSQDKIILLQISTALAAYHKIIITNSCDTPPTIDKGNLVTTKQNKNAHGFGTKSISRTIKKYKGEMQYDYDDINKIFKLIIVMPIDQTI